MPVARRTLIFGGLALAGGAASAQERPTARPLSVFERVVPRATGFNGYEELVLAVDQLLASPLYQRAEGLLGQPEGLPLALKRQVLKDPPVARALRLVQRGLAKPVTSPRDPRAMNASTLLPELSGFRQLGRVLAIQQYVQLADGEPRAAIATARTIMRLGRAVQTDTMIAGLIGIAVSTLGIRTLGSHLEQLSLPDCAELFRLCVDWLREPGLLTQVIGAERRSVQNVLNEMKAASREQLGGILGVLPGKPPREEDVEARRVMDGMEQLRANPAAVEAYFAQAQRRLDVFYAQVLEECRRPPWQRRWDQSIDRDSFAGALVATLVPAMRRVSEAYAREAALVRLLACHAAILRYRWDTDQLPENLAVLDLGPLATDPFTGEFLVYQPMGSAYRLTSAGPVATGDAPDIVDGRRPVGVDL